MRSLSVSLVFAGLLAVVWWWQRPQSMPVQLMIAVERGPVETLVANTRAGTLKSCRRSRLSFNVGGQVSELLVDAGQQVEVGQVLMRLRQDDRLARVEEACARLEVRRSEREQLCRKAELYQRDYRRLQHLGERKLTSLEHLDQAETKARLAQLAFTAQQVQIRE